jgi:predicted  nucleic acid-binding Zn-ribbon protein
VTGRDDALAALTKSVLILVDESRLARGAMAEASGKIGQLCDRLDDYTQQSDARHTDSERNIRVLQTRVGHVERQQKSLDSHLAELAAKLDRRST